MTDTAETARLTPVRTASTDTSLIGVCQPLMNALAGYLPCYSHRKTYLILFLVWSVVDIPVIAFVVRAVLGQGSGVTGA
jgi:predicted cation transporter